MTARHFIMTAFTATGLLLCGGGCSCDRESLQASFRDSDGMSLRLDGKTVLQYDAKKWQYTSNLSTNEFRVHTDNMSDYWAVQCGSLPQSVGQHVTCTVSYTDDENTNTLRSLDMEVLRVEGEKVWLWSQDKSLGVVVAVF